MTHTTHELIKTHAGSIPDAPALIAPGRKPLTYRALHQQVFHVVSKLNAMGVQRNDRVAIVLPNGPEMATAFLAVSSGATSAPLNPAYRYEEFDFYLSDLNAKALILPAGMDSPARQAARDRGTPLIELTVDAEAAAGIFSLAGERQAPVDNGGFSQPGDIALVLHTSGTTSRPKIVPLSQANLCASARHIRSTLRLTESDRCLNVMPLFHIHGLIGAVLSSVTAGASIACTPGFHAGRFFDWLREFQPSWYTAVPTMHQAVLEMASGQDEIIAQRRLRFIRSSSSSLPPKVMTALERTFRAPVIESYGMTEASHQMTSNPLPPGERKPGSVGLAAGPEVAIMDEAGQLLEGEGVGEIVIRGPNVTQGYENNPEANRNAFTNGWFRTGDEGYFDKDRYLFISGRIKEIINRGGEKVAPREVDEALLEHPAIQQAVTFAIPHPTLGEDVGAAVILRDGFDLTEEDVRRFAFSKLADFKVPSLALIVNEIPKGPTGKLQRIGLAGKLAAYLKSAYVPPGNPAETALANIWMDVLHCDQVGVNDNFFALGGDSLLAVQVVSRIRDAFQIEFPLPLIFREPKLKNQAFEITELILQQIEEMPENDAQG